LLPRFSLGDGYLELSGGAGRILLFSTGGRGTAADWVDYLTTDPRLTASEPQPIEIGGIPSTVLEVRLTGPEFPLFTYADADPGTPDVQWIVEESHVNRIFVTNIGSEAVAIIAGSAEEEATEFFAEVDAWLGELEWLTTG
jgi:hypothetical protein